MATKKIKKVEAPIDQRETFVSISKNFAESEERVEEKLKTLYALQKADTELDKILQLRGELPGEVAALEAEIAQKKEEISAVETEIAALKQAVEENKAKIVESDGLISKYQNQIENIANSREYDSLNKEIENQTLEKEIAEKNIREARSKTLDAKTALESLREVLDSRNNDLTAKNEELANIVESTKVEEAKLQAERDACAAKIDLRTMSAYERIRASVHNHLAVVKLFNDNACGGCSVVVVPQRVIDINSKKKLVICENCGRIIVSPEIDA